MTLKAPIFSAPWPGALPAIIGSTGGSLCRIHAVKAGKPAPCHFGYAGPFTEAYQLGNIALRVGHRIQWDPLDFRITNCQEANQYLRREYRRGWDLKEIAGSAWDVAARLS